MFSFSAGGGNARTKNETKLASMNVNIQQPQNSKLLNNWVIPMHVGVKK